MQVPWPRAWTARLDDGTALQAGRYGSGTLEGYQDPARLKPGSYYVRRFHQVDCYLRQSSRLKLQLLDLSSASPQSQNGFCPPKANITPPSNQKTHPLHKTVHFVHFAFFRKPAADVAKVELRQLHRHRGLQNASAWRSSVRSPVEQLVGHGRNTPGHPGFGSTRRFFGFRKAKGSKTKSLLFGRGVWKKRDLFVGGTRGRSFTGSCRMQYCADYCVMA